MRSLRAGDRGPDVQAMQLALHKALGKASRNRRNGAYGSLTVIDVERFKRTFTLRGEVDGHYAGSLVWGHLERFLGRQERALIAKAKALEAARAREGRDERIRAGVVAEAFYLLAHRLEFHYVQVRPMAANLREPAARTRTDCSAAVTLEWKGGGGPDPNGRGFDGLGYTGTLWGRGDLVRTPAPADLAFYGDMGPEQGHVPSHVALVIGGGDVISFGHSPPSRYPLRYRGDYRGTRRYPT